MTTSFHTAQIPPQDRVVLAGAYRKTRASLKAEAGLSEAELDSLSNVMTGALASLMRAGQVDQHRLSHYAVAKTLRHIWAGRR